MTASAVGAQQLEPSGRPQEPLYFPSADHQLFGWLHRAAANGQAGIGLVICKPFGYESICAHRSIRAFAEAAAAVGVPSLRFDYLGTGDSEDADAQGDVEQLAVWTQDVLAAVRELQRRTGVERVCLLGIRLGALLATLAAAQCEAASALIVVAPVLSGRRYLRELRMIQLAASKAVVVAPQTNAVAEEAKGAAPIAFEVSGFSLSPATIAALSQVDLMTLATPPSPKMLVIDRTDLPGARAWTDALAVLGARTEYVCLPGLVEMMWTAPHFAVIPRSMIAAVSDWLGRLPSAPLSNADRGPHSERPLETRSSTLRLRADPAIPQSALTERPVFFASEPMSFGIVTEPHSGEMRRRGVILLNDGATYHIGANRLYVSLARRWARRGYVVLRMDLAGLGDSATRAERPDNEVFPPAAIEDIRRAIDFMRERYGVRDITVGGLCAGAYHALQAALAALPVNRILMVNPQIFFWKEGTMVTDLQLAEVVRKRVFSAYWKRLFNGQVNVWRVAKIYTRRPWLVLESTVRNVARRLRVRLPRDLGWQLEEIAARGIRIVFAFSRDDTGIDLLKLQGGSSIKRLGERCRIHIIDGGDHIFSQSGPRQTLENVLSDELFARSPERFVAAAQSATTPGR